MVLGGSGGVGSSLLQIVKDAKVPTRYIYKYGTFFRPVLPSPPFAVALGVPVGENVAVVVSAVVVVAASCVITNATVRTRFCVGSHPHTQASGVQVIPGRPKVSRNFAAAVTDLSVNGLESGILAIEALGSVSTWDASRLTLSFASCSLLEPGVLRGYDLHRGGTLLVPRGRSRDQLPRYKLVSIFFPGSKSSCDFDGTDVTMSQTPSRRFIFYFPLSLLFFVGRREEASHLRSSTTTVEQRELHWQARFSPALVVRIGLRPSTRKGSDNEASLALEAPCPEPGGNNYEFLFGCLFRALRSEYKESNAREGRSKFSLCAR